MMKKRRQFLHLVGIAGVGTLAGCGDSAESTSAGGTQQAKLTPEDASDGDGFGSAIAVSADGTTALIGAAWEGGSDRELPATTENPDGGDVTTTENSDTTEVGTAVEPNSNGAGAAYVFEASGGSWSQQARLVAADRDSDDSFGNSVALSSDGSTAVVGAFHDEDPNGEKAGSAYVFEASGGSWSQQAKLTAADGDGGDLFGKSVALSNDGSTTVVGAANDEDPNGEKAGSAYVFEASSGSWHQQSKLTAADGDSGDWFGISVAVSDDGTTALVGAGLDGDPNGDDAGSAYVFEASGGSWTKRAILAAPDGDNGDVFGSSVALSNDGATALVGANGDEDPNGANAGSAYVFEAANGSWTRGDHSKLVADDGDGGDNFGKSVALSGDGTTALIGAESKLMIDSGGQGAAYAFEASNGSWTQEDTFTGGSDTSRFGGSLALSDDGTTVLIGDMSRLVTGVGITGMAYVFSL